MSQDGAGDGVGSGAGDEWAGLLCSAAPSRAPVLKPLVGLKGTPVAIPTAKPAASNPSSCGGTVVAPDFAASDRIRTSPHFGQFRRLKTLVNLWPHSPQMVVIPIS